jgi:hypothetical protein
MPGKLTFLGIRLPIASDDLLWPALIGMGCKFCLVICWIILLILETNSNTIFLDSASCDQEYEIRSQAFLSLNLIWSFLGVFMFIQLGRLSLQGTITDWEDRHRATTRWMWWIAFSYVGDFFLATFGVIALVVPSLCKTTDSKYYILIASVILNVFDWLCFIGFITISACCLLRKRKIRVTSTRDDPAVRIVERRLRIGFWVTSKLTCGLLGDMKTPDGSSDQAWNEFAIVVHTFLKDFMEELVPSDVLVACVLLRAEQKRREKQIVDELSPIAMDRDIIDSIGSPTSLAGNNKKPSSPPHTITTTTPPHHRNSIIDNFLWSPRTPETKQYRLKAQITKSSMPASPTSGWTSALLADGSRESNRQAAKAAYDALTLAESYTPYMLAMYGLKVFVYMNPITGLCRVACGSNARSGGINVEKRTFTYTTGLKDHHIAYSSFTAYLGEAVPYTICIDHDRRAIVLATRGTLSLPDLVTDLMATPESLEMMGRQFGFDGKGHYAHSGMLAVALRIRLDIERQQILHRLMGMYSDVASPKFTNAASPANNNNTGSRTGRVGSHVMMEDIDGGMMESEAYMDERSLLAEGSKGYRLMLVGHSLGGGVCAILGLLLREQFPSLHCMVYSPPGCIFSREMAEKSNEFVTSVVPGKDMVPRLSWHSCKVLRAQMIEMLRRSKTNKFTAWGAYLANPDKIQEKYLFKPEEVPVTQTRVDLAQLLQRLAMETETSDKLLDKIKMFIPGKVLHLSKQHTEIEYYCGGLLYSSKRKYAAMHIQDREDIQVVQVSTRMLLDHFPDVAAYYIKDVRQCLEEEFRFGGGKMNNTNNNNKETNNKMMNPPAVDLDV